MASLLLTALLGAALASEAPPPDALLDAAARLEARGQHDAARETLREVLYTSPEHRQLTRERLRELPTGWGVWGPRARLMVMQAGLWATAVGPATSYYMYEVDWEIQQRVGLSLGIAGGLAGVGVGWWYGQSWDPSRAQVSVILTSQWLAGAHGAFLSQYTREHSEGGWRGWQLGTLVGAGAGYALSRLSWDDGPVAWARAGAAWGLGIGAAVQTMRDAWDEPGTRVTPVLFLCTDLGVVGGYALAHYAGLTRQDAIMGMVGSGTLMVLMAVIGRSTRGSILWTESSAATAVMVSGLAGAGAGVALGRGVDGLIPERPPWKKDGVTLAAPGVAPGRHGGVEVSLVRGVF